MARLAGGALAALGVLIHDARMLRDMATSFTDTIGRLSIAGFAPAFLIGAYEFWTDAGWSRWLAAPMVLGAIATASYLIPRKRPTCPACGLTPAAGNFCSACGTALG